MLAPPLPSLPVTHSHSHSHYLTHAHRHTGCHIITECQQTSSVCRPDTHMQTLCRNRTIEAQPSNEALPAPGQTAETQKDCGQTDRQTDKVAGRQGGRQHFSLQFQLFLLFLRKPRNYRPLPSDSLRIRKQFPKTVLGFFSFTVEVCVKSVKRRK